MTKPLKILPLKILGFPRSGTSLLQRLLAAHPDIYCPPETYVFAGCARMIRESRGEGPDLGMLTGLSFAGFDAEEVIARVRRFGFGFLEEGAARAGKPVWAEKSAFDIFDLPEIEALLAGHCRFVCVVRHPLDVIASMKELSDQMGQTVPEMRPWMARHENYYVAWAAAWADMTRDLLALHKRMGGDSLLYRYEDLTADPVHELHRITEFAGLPPFAGDELRPDTGQIGLGDWKIFGTSTVERSPVARWRRSLPKSSALQALEFVGPLMEELGYPRPEIRAPRSRDERIRQYQQAKALAMARRDMDDKS